MKFANVYEQRSHRDRPRRTLDQRSPAAFALLVIVLVIVVTALLLF